MNKERIESRVLLLRDRCEILISYMQEKIIESDWHGVADAAMDLRDIENEIIGLQWAIKE